MAVRAVKERGIGMAKLQRDLRTVFVKKQCGNSQNSGGRDSEDLSQPLQSLLIESQLSGTLPFKKMSRSWCRPEGALDCFLWHKDGLLSDEKFLR
jgi:hypothetical protein